MKILSLLLTLCLLTILPASAQVEPTGAQVSGEATQNIVNDRASFHISIEAKGETPKAARDNLLVQAKALQNLLDTFPQAEKSKTLHISSTPIWIRKPGTAPTINGYNATTVTSTECPAESAGDLAAKLLELNPQNLNGPNFHISETVRKAKEKELLQAATKDAQDKAQTLADAAGVKLGAAVFLSTQTIWPGMEGPVAMMSRTSQAEDSFAAMPAQIGEGKLRATVMARFELLPKVP